MRISTQTFYDRSLNSLQSQQTALSRLGMQVGTQTRVMTASDDPIAAIRALGIGKSLSVNAQFAASRTQANQSLGLSDNVLGNVASTTHKIKELLVQAGDNALSDVDRAAIATQLESQMDQLMGLANTRDGNGQYLYAGFKSASPPFIKQADGSVSYVGDQGERLMQVDAARQMAANDNGRSIFQSVQANAKYIGSTPASNTGSAMFKGTSVVNANDPNFGKDFDITFLAGEYKVMTKDTPPVVIATGPYKDGGTITFGGMQMAVTGTPVDGDVIHVTTAKNAGTDMFSALSDVISALRQPASGGGSPAFAKINNALSTANVKFSNALDNVLTVATSVGARMAELDMLDEGGEDRRVSEEGSLENLVGLDMIGAISQLERQKMAMQATMLTIMKVQSLSLMDYVK
ncbi:flagellar hook-associated protein FlgL [Glaciimonas soli]|uniref:Flagellar hook-associated protein 3 n=1 Tax=Glaciimonas soli TaxID=2590999 RepID=A0A843YRW7_9BURK|nr:flagellar hook-associated protein FlgL [Glaciimonas soli]MQQ99455.1 flagellar hook-associated protein 3 [Glaciimonas soli]